MNLPTSSFRRSLATLPAFVAATLIATPAAAQKVTASLNVGVAPYAIAVNDSTNKIYVTDTVLSQVAVVNGATNAVGTVAVGALPEAIAINPATNKIYVANAGGLLAQNTVTVIDGSTNATTTLTLGAGALQPDCIAVNPNTNKIYVATYGGAIAVIDGSSNAVSAVNAAAGTNPVAIAVNLSTNKVFVACTPTSVLAPASATLTVIDGTSNATTTVAAGSGLFDIEVNASANQLFLGSSVSNTLTELDALTTSVLGSITAGAPKCIAVNPATGIVYYVSSVLGNVVAYNPATGISTTLTLASSPLTGRQAIAIDVSRNKIYVACSLGIAAIDGATNAVTPVQTGLACGAIALNPTTGQVYVADALGQLTVVDPLTTHLSVVASGPASAGSPLTVTVTALDASGATVSGYAGTVHISSSDLSATLPANKMLTNGVGSFSVTLNNPGSATVSAADILATTISGTTGSLLVGSGSAPTPTPVVTSPTPTPVVTSPTPTPTPVTGSASTGTLGSIETSIGNVGSSGTSSPVGGSGVTISTSTGTDNPVTPTPTPVTTAPVVKSLLASQQVLVGGVLALQATADSAESFQWYFNGVPLTNGGNVSGAQSATLMIVNVTLANAGNYSYVASNSLGSTTSTAQSVGIGGTSNAGRLVNISCRSQVGTGGNILIAGFIVGGEGTAGTETVLVRASGPALSQFGITNYLPDPVLDLYQDTELLASDFRWAADSTINATAAAVGAFQWTSATSQDSALLQSLPVGAYTAQVTGQTEDTGVALAEVYDATPAASYTTTSPRLINISARVRVGAGSNTLIAGFVVGGSTSCTVMIRATGPGLAGFGVPDYLPDPKLQVFSGSTLIASNTGWDANSQITWASSTVGAFPWDGKTPDSAVIMTLPPGAYTAQVTGASGDSGVALVEVYEVR